MVMTRKILFAMPLVVLCGPVPAQELPVNSAPAMDLAPALGILGTRDFMLAIALLVFGLAVLLVQFLQLRNSAELTADAVMRQTVVTLIVIGTLLMIALGLSSEQIAPALGLFGTIAGYLLGRPNQAAQQAGKDKDAKS